MAYTKQNFTDGQVLTAKKLNDMDNQIYLNAELYSYLCINYSGNNILNFKIHDAASGYESLLTDFSQFCSIIEQFITYGKPVFAYSENDQKVDQLMCKCDKTTQTWSFYSNTITISGDVSGPTEVNFS